MNNTKVYNNDIKTKEQIRILIKRKNLKLALKKAYSIKDDYLRKDQINYVDFQYSILAKKYLESKNYDALRMLCLENTDSLYMISYLVSMYIAINDLESAKSICLHYRESNVFKRQLKAVYNALSKEAMSLYKSNDLDSAIALCLANMDSEDIVYTYAVILTEEGLYTEAKSFCINREKEKGFVRLLDKIYKRVSCDINNLIKNYKFDEAKALCEAFIESDHIKSQYVTVLLKKRMFDEAIIICENEENPILSNQLNKIYDLIYKIIIDLINYSRYEEAYELILKYNSVEKINNLQLKVKPYINNCNEDSMLSKIDNSSNSDVTNLLSDLSTYDVVKRTFYKCIISVKYIDLHVDLTEDLDSLFNMNFNKEQTSFLIDEIYKTILYYSTYDVDLYNKLLVKLSTSEILDVPTKVNKPIERKFK